MKAFHAFLLVFNFSFSSIAIDTDRPNAVYRLNRRPRNCGDIQISGYTESGTYKIFPASMKENEEGVDVLCDLDQGEGWTVLMRQVEMRASQQVDFNRIWSDYARGFGDFDVSFWLGLDVISSLTQGGNFQLRVDLEDWEGNATYAIYNIFQVGNASDLYKLNVTGYVGNAGDSPDHHNGMVFTTIDQDNDERASNCAVDYTGGWCFRSHPTGTYNGTGHIGVTWTGFRGDSYSLKRTEMKIRERDFKCFYKDIKAYFN